MTSEVGAAEQVVVLGATPVRLGRADDNDVVLLEQAASRHHARVEPTDDGGYQIVDLSSTAGLTVNSEAMGHRRLSDGDEIRVGATTVRFVENPGSEPTLVPTDASPSSLATEVGDAPAPTDAPPGPEGLGDADTILPGDAPSSTPTDVTTPEHDVRSTVHAPHQPAPPPSPAVLPPQGTIQAPHQPASPPPAAQSPEPAATPHAESSPSFVLGAGPSSPSAYSLEGTAAAPGRSGGYSLEGAGRDDGFAMDTVPPTALAQSSGGGAYVFMVFLGAAAAFGILIAVQGVPW